METYTQRAINVTNESQIAVQILLSAGNDDIEFVSLRPCLSPAAFMPKAEFTARKLRTVGVIGLRGITPTVAFREALDPCIVDAIGTEFAEYVRVLISGGLEQQYKGGSLEWCQRLYALEDPRQYSNLRYEA